MYDKAVMDNATLSKQAAEALTYLQSKVPAELHKPVIGIICGSGLNGLAESVLPEPRCEVSYANVPHFPLSTGKANTSGHCNMKTTLMNKLVPGHAGKLLFGLFELNEKPVVLMVGRVQSVFNESLSYSKTWFMCLRSYYEGHSIQSITFPIRLMKRLGVRTIIGMETHDSVRHH